MNTSKTFTKDRMILEIKQIRDLTIKEPIPSIFFANNYKTLQSYGVIADLCNENFMKKNTKNKRVWYSWNFDTKLTPNDFDFFYAKAIKKRKGYYASNKSNPKVKVEKEKIEKINESEIIDFCKPNSLSLFDNTKLQELEDLVTAKDKEIARLNNTITHQENTIGELISKLNQAQENKQSSFRSVVKKQEPKQAKYLKLFGIKIYEKN